VQNESTIRESGRNQAKEAEATTLEALFDDSRDAL
jgi:hypothetical protein